MPIYAFRRASEPAAPAVARYGAPTLAAVKLALRVDGDESDSILARNIEAMTALAMRQAPNAPEAVAHEAIIRAVAWCFEGATAGATDSGLWRRAGSQGLLRPWTKRRAGAIG